VLLLLLLLAADAETSVIELRPAATGASKPAAPAPLLRFRLVEARPDSLKDIPPLSAAARYATLDVAGGKASFAFETPEGSRAFGHLYGEGRGEPLRAEAIPFAGGFHVRWEDVPCRGTRANVLLTYRGGLLEDAVFALAVHRRGRGAIGGAVREVILVDGDADGRYDGPKDRWVAFRVDRLASVPSITLASMMLLAEPQIPFEADGRALQVERVRPDGTAISLRIDVPKKTVEEVLERRYAEVQAGYFERFAREAGSFAREWGLDRARPRAASAAPWRRMSLPEAKEAARRARKPLLVEYFSESNPFCWLARYWTYPDREVDALLSGYVLVSIDAEKDPERSTAALGVTTLPALVPFTSAGERVTFDLLVRGADGATQELRGERSIAGWHRPQEMAQNLRRVARTAR